MSTPALPWWHDLDLDAAPDLTPAASSALAWRVAERQHSSPPDECHMPDRCARYGFCADGCQPEPPDRLEWGHGELVPFDREGCEAAYEAVEREGW